MTLLDPRLRDDFPILSHPREDGAPLVYLDNAASTQRPRAVLDSLRRVYEQQYGNVHRGSHRLASLSTQLYEDARETVRAFLGAEHLDEIVFTSGTTLGINTVARAWGDANIRAGDEILVTELEHHSNIVPWQQLASRSGATVRWLPITDDGRLDLSRWDEVFSPRTKLVAVTAVSNVLGTVTDVAEIVRRAKAGGAATLIDAAQSVPHRATDVRAWDCDFLVFSGHKVVGPNAIGGLYLARRRQAEMPAFLGGGSMIDLVRQTGFTEARSPQRFEAGTPPIGEAIALAEAIRYVTSIGLDAITEHERELTRLAHDGLEQVGGIRILGPAPEAKEGIVGFVSEWGDPASIASLLDEQNVAIREGHHCAMPLHQRLGVSASARASFYLYNTAEDVERFVEAARKAKSLLDRPRTGRRRVAQSLAGGDQGPA